MSASRDPLDWMALGFGIAYAILLGGASGRVVHGLLAGLANCAVALGALVLLPVLRRGTGLSRFFGVTLPLLVFYVYYREGAIALGRPNVIWLDSVVAGIELGWWETLSVVPGPGLLGEVMAFAYMAYVPLLLFVAAALLKAPSDPDSHAEAFIRQVCVAWAICYVAFILLPVQGPRFFFPELQAPRMGEGPFSALAQVNQTQGMLRGAAFPSAHVAATFVALWSVWRWRRLVFWLMLPIGTAMAVGAVYLAYHYAIDVAAGIVVGLAAVAIDSIVLRWVAARAPLGGGAAQQPDAAR